MKLNSCMEILYKIQTSKKRTRFLSVNQIIARTETLLRQE
jgi:hypothetical protein